MQQIRIDKPCSDSLSPLAIRLQLGPQCLHRQFDILRDGRQKAALIPSDGVSCHAELFRQFALSETKEEPLPAKLPTRQPPSGYVGEHRRSSDHSSANIDSVIRRNRAPLHARDHPGVTKKWSPP